MMRNTLIRWSGFAGPWRNQIRGRGWHAGRQNHIEGPWKHPWSHEPL